MALAYTALGQFARAEEAYLRAIQRGPHYAYLHYSLAASSAPYPGPLLFVSDLAGCRGVIHHALICSKTQRPFSRIFETA